MKRRMRFSILALIAVAVMVMANAGSALAAWVWCDDPILEVGGTRLYVVYAVDSEDGTRGSFAPNMVVSVPSGVSYSLIDPQGWTVNSDAVVDPSLKVKPVKIEATLDVTINPTPSTPADFADKAKVKVSLDPLGRRVIGNGTGEIGENIHIKVNVPSGKK